MDIRRFLCKKRRIENEDDVGEFSRTELQTQTNIAENDTCKKQAGLALTSTEVEFNLEVPESSSLPVCSLKNDLSSYDIRLFVQKSAADGINSIPGLQKKIWSPPDGYIFPASGPRSLKFQRSWLQKHPWLAYSAIEDGAYCKYCVLFCASFRGFGNQTLGQLVTTPLKNWKNALEIFERHISLEYHKKCLLQWSSRLGIGEENALPIDLQLSKQKLDFLNESKLHMIPIIETVILCGRQGLALRGSNDTGRISEDEPLTNDGNFRALLRYRAKTDERLKKHLSVSPKNAMYISNRVQNEIINICHHLIMSYNIDRVNKSKGFSFLGDDTPDIAGVEQSSICIRYLDKCGEKFIIQEDFLCFIPITDFTGKGIGSAYLDFLKSSGLDCTYFFGQGYDSARAVSGEFQGAQAVVRKTYPLALYSHCAAHSFNLAVSSACNITGIKNCLGVLENIHSFFIYPKRQNALQDAINENEHLSETRVKKLKNFCKTRWVEQHESVATYLHLQPAVIRALEVISTSWKDPTTSSGAFQLLSAIKTANFQISMHILSSVHSLTLSLSRILQGENQDLGEAIKLADAAKQVLMERRENAEGEFKHIFKAVSEISEQYEIELRKPRIASKQTQRSNVQTNSAEDYFRITIYIPYIDSFLTQLQDRFLNHRNILSNFACLFPNKMQIFEEESCAQLFQSYCSILHDDSREIWVNEVQLWRKLIAGMEIKNSLEALDICNEDAFPNVNQMLRVMAVLPVTTATNERSFSTLRRLKTYLRSTMSEDRLNGLASLNVHRDVKIDPQIILKEFFSVPRRVDLLNKCN